MIDKVVFQNIHLLWPVIVASVCFWIIFIWKEWEAKLGIRFYLKVTVALFAVCSLAMIALKPSLRTMNKTSYVAILTEGYKEVNLDSLRQAHRRMQTINYRSGEDLTKQITKGQEVFVLGNGMEVFDLWQLDSVKTYFLEGKIPEGITKLKYEQESIVGKEFEVRGNYSVGGLGQYLVLTGPANKPLDSVLIEENNHQIFNLKSTHEVEGKYVYAVLEKDSLGTLLNSSPISVEVLAKDKLKVIVINQFPSFETKYLKNFLSEQGHEVIVRSQVSSDRYKYEFFNSARKGSISMSSETLNEADLLIVDMPSLRALSKTILNRLQSAITERGLGLFIQTDEVSYTSNIPLFEVGFEPHDQKEVQIDKESKLTLAKHSFQFKEDDLLEKIHIFDMSIVTAYKRFGAGRIGSTVLHNTYQLILQGEANSYQKLWSKTISLMSKRKGTGTTNWSSKNLFAVQNKPFDFQLKTVFKDPIVHTATGSRIPLIRHIDLEQVWSGKTFPRKLGWNQILIDNDSTEVYNYYVVDSSRWTSLAATKRRFDNNSYVKENRGKSFKGISLKTLPSWWFFIVFLVAMTVLWLEPKL